MTQDLTMPHDSRNHLTARRILLAMLLTALLAIAGCAPAAPADRTPPPTPTFDPERLAFAGDEAEVALPLLVQTERNAAAAGDLALLAHLWAEDATIVERRGGASESDDYRWEGRAAILDRYMVAVAQNRPAPLAAPPDAPISIDGDAAILINGVDTWRFVFRDDRWWIESLEIAP